MRLSGILREIQQTPENRLEEQTVIRRGSSWIRRLARTQPRHPRLHRVGQYRSAGTHSCHRPVLLLSFDRLALQTE